LESTKNHWRVTKMPRSTSPLEPDAGQPLSPVSDGDARNSLQQKDGHFDRSGEHRSSFRRPGEGPALQELLRWLARSLAVMAVMSSVALLCVGATPLLDRLPTFIARASVQGWAVVKSLPLSALPLLLAGSSYLLLQAILRPRPLELLKRVMLAVAFLLWGVVQLMPASSLATELGNVVIALYVIDLGLIIWTDLQKNEPEFAR
jgi:hypothetical protein